MRTLYATCWMNFASLYVLGNCPLQLALKWGFKTSKKPWRMPQSHTCLPNKFLLCNLIYTFAVGTINVILTSKSKLSHRNKRYFFFWMGWHLSQLRNSNYQCIRQLRGQPALRVLVFYLHISVMFYEMDWKFIVNVYVKTTVCRHIWLIIWYEQLIKQVIMICYDMMTVRKKLSLK